MKKKRNWKRAVVIVVIAIVVVFFFGPVVVKNLLVRMTLAELMGVCEGKEEFFSVVNKLSFEEDPLQYLQELRQQPERIERLPNEGDLRQASDKVTKRLIAARYVEIAMEPGGEEKINCIKALKEGFTWMEFIAAKKENEGRVYYREIRRVEDNKNNLFLRVVVVLRPRPEEIK